MTRLILVRRSLEVTASKGETCRLTMTQNNNRSFSQTLTRSILGGTITIYH